MTYRDQASISTVSVGQFLNMSIIENQQDPNQICVKAWFWHTPTSWRVGILTRCVSRVYIGACENAHLSGTPSPQLRDSKWIPILCSKGWLHQHRLGDTQSHNDCNDSYGEWASFGCHNSDRSVRYMPRIQTWYSVLRVLLCSTSWIGDGQTPIGEPSG